MKMSDMAMKYEDWLRGCVHHDGRKGNVYLPCDAVLAIADWIEAHRDVAPVRHGRWAEKGTITDEKAEVITEWQSARCTCCNKYHTTPYLYYFDNFAYCPNCGAKMDE